MEYNCTYEAKDSVTKLERYEWDNTWWEQTGDNVTPRVLYIGDSISGGIRQQAQRCSDNKLLFDRFGTSKAVDNAFLIESIRLFGRQQERRDLIIFNNGLHGWHLDDAVDYGIHYENIVKFLLEEYAGTPLVLASTTSVVGERNERVIARNEAAQKIAAQYSLPVIDLYATSVEYFELLANDGIHFQEEGYVKLAEKLLESIYPIIPLKE